MMKTGDPVRVRVPERRRLVRGVVREVRRPEGEGVRVVVAVGLRTVEAPADRVTVIRRRRERELVRAQVEGVRAEAARLAAALRGRRGVI